MESSRGTFAVWFIPSYRRVGLLPYPQLAQLCAWLRNDVRSYKSFSPRSRRIAHCQRGSSFMQFSDGTVYGICSFFIWARVFVCRSTRQIPTSLNDHPCLYLPTYIPGEGKVLIEVHMHPFLTTCAHDVAQTRGFILIIQDIMADQKVFHKKKEKKKEPLSGTRNKIIHIFFPVQSNILASVFTSRLTIAPHLFFPLRS